MPSRQLRGQSPNLRQILRSYTLRGRGVDRIGQLGRHRPGRRLPADTVSALTNWRIGHSTRRDNSLPVPSCRLSHGYSPRSVCPSCDLPEVPSVRASRASRRNPTVPESRPVISVTVPVRWTYRCSRHLEQPPPGSSHPLMMLPTTMLPIRAMSTLFRNPRT